ncbi:hypothetical protein BaRGS_00027163 [Batillaria attramentaria]|uniref:Uncharacterized protein n=1 Tax=Batillaria attramentaria TaxID=370345 RepID=A0ABD0K3G8_9CAEN
MLLNRLIACVVGMKTLRAALYWTPEDGVRTPVAEQSNVNLRPRTIPWHHREAGPEQTGVTGLGCCSARQLA